MAAVPRRRLATGLEVSRLAVGLWQVADLEREGGPGIDHAAAIRALAAYRDAGITTCDMADHYGSAEELVGSLASGPPGAAPTEALTKWVPKPGPESASEAAVDAAVRLSLARLRLPRIPLLQFHTWDYLDGPGAWLDQLKMLQSHALVEHVGLTNVDAAHLRLALAEGISVASDQVSFSLIDRRAAGDLSALCQARGVGILAYGVLAGGLLTDRFLGRPEPSEAELQASWSLAKYRRFVESFGGWALLQELLRVLRGVADRHYVDGSCEGPTAKRPRVPVSIANVAVRWVLGQAAVAAVLVGARLGHSEHIAENLRVFQFDLTDQDRAEIDRVLARASPIHGDCGDEYRRPPFLTAKGDLSDHLSHVPMAFEVKQLPGHTPDFPRLQVQSGTSWEGIAGFSRALRLGDRVCISGTTPTRQGRAVGGDDAGAQTTFALDIAEASLRALGGSLADVLRTRLYVRRLEDWEAVARAHGQRFREHHPANTLVQAGLVGEEYLVEVELEALLGPRAA